MYKHNKKEEEDISMAHVDTCGFFMMFNEVLCHWFHEKLSNVILR
jgi:hypothetical protein